MNYARNLARKINLVSLCTGFLWCGWGGPSLGAAEAPRSSAPGDTNLPLTTIRQFLDGARGWGETRTLRLQGVVTASLWDKTYFLQDGDAGVYIFHRPTPALRVGEWVEVTGKPSLGNLRPLLDGLSVRSLGRRESPLPVAVTFAEAMSGRPHMRLIRIQGRLAEERPRGGRHLVLNAGGSTNSFLADLETLSDYDVVARIPPGSLLELTGVCNLRADATRTRPVSLTIFARSAADVVVLSGPPWWTRVRMLSVLGLALGALGMTLLWGRALRRQVGRQTAALRASEEYRRAIIEAGPECVQVVAADGALLEMNAAGLAMFEAGSLAEMKHRPIVRFIRPEYHAAFAELQARVMAGGGGILEFEIEGLKGARRWLETHAVQLPGTDGGRPALLGITRDITERKRTQAELQCSQERFATIFRASPDAILIVNAADERIIEVNPAYTRLTGYSAEELQGHTTGEIHLWVDPEQRAIIAARLKKNGSVSDVELPLRTKSGRVITVLGSAELIEFGGVPCVLGISRDITDRKLAEERIAHLNADLEQRVRERTAELESANQELETFSYSVSHDLRAPLRAIDGFSSILQHDFSSQLGETGRSHLDRIRAGTGRMGQLIDDMLNLSHVSRAPMKRVPVDLSLLVQGLLVELRTLAPSRQVEAVVAPDITAEADATLLHAVLQNLVGNAWKYTGRRPQARIEFGAFDHDGEQVFFVRDDGAGFDMAYADKLFDAFQRLHHEEEFEGNGIGLTTVQRIILRHGGRVWAEGAVDQGATFYFTLAPKTERL